ncbi:MAG: prephenate dehydrogenase/arogenate dehydrogenase family protein [Limnochordia bacterium]|jgi:prephenate dehydrogenase
MRRISIVGLGLIGGSLGLALRCRTEDVYVVGFDTSPETCSDALNLGAVDQIASSIEEAFSGSELVFLATPIRGIIDYLHDAARFCKPGCIVTDMGSTKTLIMQKAAEILPGEVVFIGGHPMAGKERSGIFAASPHLFENAAYVLTPPDSGHGTELSTLRSVIEIIGAFPVLLSPDEHDLIVAAVSHLPHICAVALANTVGNLAPQYPDLLALAAGGFRDTTRVASGDPRLWCQILETNRGHINSMIEEFKGVLSDLQRALQTDSAALYQGLCSAKGLRDELPKHSRRLTNYYELSAQVADEPGTIGQIAGVLAQAGVNISDIEIMRAREGEAGVLRLGFNDEKQVDQALKVLRTNGYVVKRRS